MSDYIIREAAIELLEKAFDNNWEVSGTMDRIRAIPAADVIAADVYEEQSIVLESYRNRMKAGCDWIPVTERLPEDSGNYLTTFNDGSQMCVNEYMHPRDWLTEEGSRMHPNGKWYYGGVTHWMPLPEPPKEG